MIPLNRALIGVELFCYWYFLSTGFSPLLGQASFVLASVSATWSIYNGIKWHFAKRDGEGLAWAVLGGIVFLGLTARWLVEVR